MRPSLLALLAAPTLLAAQISTAEFQARRDAVLARVGDGVVLVFGAPEPSENHLSFEQSQNFRYLTGFLEPDARLVLRKKGGATSGMLFVQPKDPAQEVWTGNRRGAAGATAKLGLTGRDESGFDATIDSLLAGGDSLFVAGDFTRGEVKGVHDQWLAALRAKHPNTPVRDISRAVLAVRAKRSDAELDRLRIAAEISAKGHADVMRAVQPGMYEFELQAITEATWRRQGADRPGYPSIVGSGPNSTTLHYNRNDRQLQAGDVIVMDMAAAYDGYSADITRTVPVSGKFTPAQRDIYGIVLSAQKSAERQLTMGTPWRTVNDSSTAALRDGLARVGLIEAPTATFDCQRGAQMGQCPQLQLYYMHSLGHGIGLDVHDPDITVAANGTVQPGAAFTLEPGIYVRGNTLDIIPDTPRNREFKAKIAAAVQKYANIGTRIEDDYLITAKGMERPSAGVPRELDEVEKLLATPRTPRKDVDVVNQYKTKKTG